MRQCNECGEKLMGAVNRCWRCGAEQAAIPVRAEERAAVDSLSEESVESSSAQSEGVPLRFGSPFQTEIRQGGASTETPAAVPERGPGERPPATASKPTGSSVKQPAPTPSTPAPIVPSYPQHLAALSGGIGSLLLGVMALFCMWLIPVGSMIIALVGIAFGMWGLYARRKEPAVFGILLCVLALGVGSYLAAVEWYTYVYGVSPWEPDPLLNSPLGPSSTP